MNIYATASQPARERDSQPASDQARAEHGYSGQPSDERCVC
jgi:hypothetical protein